MKRILIFLLTISFTSSNFCQTQTLINKTDGTANSLLPTEIKNISFKTYSSTSDILPLGVNNAWNFIGTHYDSLGSIIATGSISSNILSDTVIQGTTWYFHNSTILDPSVLFAEKADGLWGLSLSPTQGFSALFLKYPAIANETYPSLHFDTDTSLVVVISTNQAITVPAGTFSCHHYHLSLLGSDIADFYLSPGTGWVRVEIYGKKPNGQSYLSGKLELSSYAMGIKEKPLLPKQTNLSQNYPNPFNSSTIISFHIPSTTHVLLKIFDVLGREITNLVSGQIEQGDHSVIWDASAMSSGTYFYRFQSGDFVDTKKLVLIK